MKHHVDFKESLKGFRNHQIFRFKTKQTVKPHTLTITHQKCF